ncbi:GNAT family N-acetyltransferase [Nocardia sp. NPDC127579]|uniref:GNAT family N-acetyltransferase n=1 Tax=Nocardia sp. NPDC127579 TaxID=3345402 RepID=UPI003630DB04
MDIDSVRILELEPEQWDRFRAIRLRALAEAPYAFAYTLADARGRPEQSWRDLLAARTLFLATTGELDLGTIGVATIGGGAHIMAMWVAPDARGTGVADLLVRTVLDWATRTGHPRADLEVSDGNIAAERLYHRHGFRRTGAVRPISDTDPRLEFDMTLTLAQG